MEPTGYPDLDELAQRLDRVRALDARELEAEEIAVLGRKAGALTALLRRVAATSRCRRAAAGSARSIR
jgi:hypothetical protein